MRRKAVLFVLGAAVLFAVSNVAWRLGGGSTVAVVALRAVLGAGVAWAFTVRSNRPRWTTALRSSAGRLAVVVAGADLVAAGTMFRALDGTLAGLALACTPAVALLVRDRAGRSATAAALGSSAAAVVGLVAAAAADDGSGASWSGVLVAAAFVALEVAMLRTGQVAVLEGVDPGALVTASMVVSAVVLAPVAVVTARADLSGVLLPALGAALVVALVGTTGRVLRTASTPAAGVTAAAAAAQVTALGTALGGIVVLGDRPGPVGLACTVLAAALGAAAVVSATRWRLARDARLAAALEARPGAAGPVVGAGVRSVVGADDDGSARPERAIIGASRGRPEPGRRGDTP